MRLRCEKWPAWSRLWSLWALWALWALLASSAAAAHRGASLSPMALDGLRSASDPAGSRADTAVAADGESGSSAAPAPVAVDAGAAASPSARPSESHFVARFAATQAAVNRVLLGRDLRLPLNESDAAADAERQLSAAAWHRRVLFVRFAPVSLVAIVEPARRSSGATAQPQRSRSAASSSLVPPRRGRRTVAADDDDGDGDGVVRWPRGLLVAVGQPFVVSEAARAVRRRLALRPAAAADGDATSSSSWRVAALVADALHSDSLRVLGAAADDDDNDATDDAASRRRDAARPVAALLLNALCVDASPAPWPRLGAAAAVEAPGALLRLDADAALGVDAPLALQWLRSPVARALRRQLPSLWRRRCGRGDGDGDDAWRLGDAAAATSMWLEQAPLAREETPEEQCAAALACATELLGRCLTRSWPFLFADGDGDAAAQRWQLRLFAVRPSAAGDVSLRCARFDASEVRALLHSAADTSGGAFEWQSDALREALWRRWDAPDGDGDGDGNGDNDAQRSLRAVHEPQPHPQSHGQQRRPRWRRVAVAAPPPRPLPSDAAAPAASSASSAS
jgi:hypothetical protein